MPENKLLHIVRYDFRPKILLWSLYFTGNVSNISLNFGLLHLKCITNSIYSTPSCTRRNIPFVFHFCLKAYQILFRIMVSVLFLSFKWIFLWFLSLLFQQCQKPPAFCLIHAKVCQVYGIRYPQDVKNMSVVYFLCWKENLLLISKHNFPFVLIVTWIYNPLYKQWVSSLDHFIIVSTIKVPLRKCQEKFLVPVHRQNKTKKGICKLFLIQPYFDLNYIWYREIKTIYK